MDEPAAVTVTLNPREDQLVTGTDITIEWSDPDGCDSRYFVGVYNNEALYRVERSLGYHSAPATTTTSANLNLSWDSASSSDWWAGVICTSGWRVVGKVPVASGLPTPAIAITDLGATVGNGQSDGFTVSASDLDADARYTIQVTTDDADLGFDRGCTDRQEDVTVTAASTSHTATLTLHGCGAPGGTVTATLLSGGATIDTATQDVTVPNTAATGEPTIGGTAQARETLTADTSSIADADGLDNVTYGYQWLADDADIAEATAATYTLSDDDVGKVIKVRVSFTDDADNEETLTSAATEAVAVMGAEAADGPVWSADMLVVEYTSVSIGAASADLFSNVGGSADLQIKWLWYDTVRREVRLSFTEGVADADDLILQIGDVSLTFPEGSSNSSGFTFTDVDVSWTDGQTLAVSLVRADQPDAP